MSKRFDYRNKETFKKDIFFGTMLEKYWWESWLKLTDQRSDINVTNAKDNGCDNNGEFIEDGSTFGADFMADISYDNRDYKNCPLEMKWVPTAGKFTLKENDLKAYIREGAGILFIYNSVSCGTDFRKPEHYDLEKHIALIESKIDQVKWGLMWPEKVKEFYEYAQDNNLIKPIYYMGNKPAVVLQQQYFSRWFKQENWK